MFGEGRDRTVRDWDMFGAGRVCGGTTQVHEHDGLSYTKARTLRRHEVALRNRVCPPTRLDFWITMLTRATRSTVELQGIANRLGLNFVSDDKEALILAIDKGIGHMKKVSDSEYIAKALLLGINQKYLAKISPTGPCLREALKRYVARVGCGWVVIRTTPYRTTPHRTVPYRTVPHRTTPYRVVPYRTVLHRTVQYHIVPYHTIPHRTVPYRTAPYGTVSHRTGSYRITQ